jgi:hypothetical protein
MRYTRRESPAARFRADREAARNAAATRYREARGIVPHRPSSIRRDREEVVREQRRRLVIQRVRNSQQNNN